MLERTPLRLTLASLALAFAEIVPPCPRSPLAVPLCTVASAARMARLTFATLTLAYAATAYEDAVVSGLAAGLRALGLLAIFRDRFQLSPDGRRQRNSASSIVARKNFPSSSKRPVPKY